MTSNLFSFHPAGERDFRTRKLAFSKFELSLFNSDVKLFAITTSLSEEFYLFLVFQQKKPRFFKHRNRGVLDLGRMSESIQPALCKFSSTRIFQLQRLTFVFLQTSSLLKKRHWVLFSLYRVFMSSAKVYQRIVNSCQCFMTLHDYKNSVKRTFFHYNTSIPFKTVVFCFKPSTFLPAFMT